VLARVLIAIPLFVILAAGLAKIVDLGEFRASLDTWTLLSDSMRDVLTPTVPAAELAVGAWWLILRGRQRAVCAGAVLLLVYSLAYSLHYLLAAPPACGCMGKFLVFEHAQETAVFLLGRNATLLLMLAGGLWLTPATTRTSPILGNGRHAIPVRKPGASAFTLIETIITIALVALLIGLILPALGTLRDRARRTDPLADLRSHAQIHAMYTNDFQGSFLYYTDPEADRTRLEHPGFGTMDVLYFQPKNLWHWPIFDLYYDNSAGDAFISAWDRDIAQHPAFSSYHYPGAFLARPEFWQYETRTGPGQWRPTGMRDAAFPAHKAILYSSPSMFPPIEEQLTPKHIVRASFIDGSARNIPYRELTHPYFHGEGQWHGSWWTHGIPIEHTIEGVRGRDVPP